MAVKHQSCCWCTAHSQTAQLQQPLDSGSDDSDFVSTSESEDEEMAADEPDAEVRSQDGEAEMEVATTSGKVRCTRRLTVSLALPIVYSTHCAAIVGKRLQAPSMGSTSLDKDPASLGMHRCSSLSLTSATKEPYVL